MICHCKKSREERAAAYEEAIKKGLTELIGYIKKQKANGDPEAARVLQNWDITRP